ncbi:hypothetical protein OROGR_022414 [Orobanche gracilis]
MTEEKDQQSETTGYKVQSKRPRILYDAGAPAPSTNPGFNSIQSGGVQFVMKIPNDKVLYLIGRYGQTIKNIQTKSGALIEIGPMHVPCDDTSTEKSVYINGETQQIEGAKELVDEVICGIPSETNNYLQLLPFPPGTNSYMQQKGWSYPLSGTWTPLAHAGDRAPFTTVELFMMQARAKNQKIGPLHLPHGDASTEKSVDTTGWPKQIETTNELLKEIIKGKRVVNASGPNSYKLPLSYHPGTNSYMQQQVSYPPSGTWALQGQPPVQQQQPQYGYFQPGAYGTPPVLASSHGTNSYMQQQVSYPPSGTWALQGQPPVQQQQPQYGYFQPGAYGTPPVLASSHGNYLPPVGDWNLSNQLYEIVKSLAKIVEEHEVTIKNLTEAQAGCQKCIFQPENKPV